MSRPYNMSGKKNGMTLIELILSMVLLGVVILAGISMDIGLRRLFTSSDVESELLDETTPILAMIAKDINRGIGDAGNLPYDNSNFASDWAFRVRIDTALTPSNYADDRWVVYRWRTTGAPAERFQLWYYPTNTSSSYIVLTNRTSGISISAPVNGISTISLQMRKDPSQAVSYTNQEISVTSEAQFRSLSLS